MFHLFCTVSEQFIHSDFVSLEHSNDLAMEVSIIVGIEPRALMRFPVQEISWTGIPCLRDSQNLVRFLIQAYPPHSKMQWKSNRPELPHAIQ